jgi:hypothetical protein
VCGAPDAGTCALHSNGLGESYSSCSPLGSVGVASTYTLGMATQAASSWPGGGTISNMYCAYVTGTADVVQQLTASQCAVWVYDTSLAGYVALTTGTGSCGSACCCPTGSTTDYTWN